MIILSAEAVTASLDELLRSLPGGISRLVSSTRSDGGAYVEVIPSNPKSARVVIDLERDGTRAYLRIGQRLDVEIDALDAKRKGGPIEEIVAYCQAAVDGRVEETVWKHGDSIWKSSGRIDLLTRVVRPTVVEGFSLGRLRKSTSVHYGYAPYSTVASKPG